MKMVNANAHVTYLTQAGDMTLDLKNHYGKKIGTLPVLNAHIVPDAAFSLLSLTQLLKIGVTFIFTEEGSMMQIDGFSYPLIKKDNLLLINLSTTIRAEVTVTGDNSLNGTFCTLRHPYR